MGLNAFAVFVPLDVLRFEPETTTSAEPADVEIVWTDDDGSTVDHREGE